MIVSRYRKSTAGVACICMLVTESRLYTMQYDLHEQNMKRHKALALTTVANHMITRRYLLVEWRPPLWLIDQLSIYFFAIMAN